MQHRAYQTVKRDTGMVKYRSKEEIEREKDACTCPECKEALPSCMFRHKVEINPMKLCNKCMRKKKNKIRYQSLKKACETEKVIP